MNVSKRLDDLRVYIESEGFKGYDPYDALNSPLLKVLSRSWRWARIACIQGFKGLHLNIRPLLGIKKNYNPKGLGLLLWGYTKLYRIEPRPEYLKTIDVLLNKLDELKSHNCSGHSWGYPFDWQSRVFYIPKFIPTVVNSAFIGHALLDAWRYARREQALYLAVPIKDFILRDLNRLETGAGICFSYTPVDRYFVHNANLLGASLLIRLFDITGDKELKTAALAALIYSMSHQREDGSWFYAEREGSHWIDSFHTGFILQSIRYFLDGGYDSKRTEAFNKGVAFYRNSFFLTNGTPKYYPNQIFPIDIHCPAQAVVFFSRMGEEFQQFTDRILRWMVLNMQDKAGFFYFRKHRFFTNRIPYMRWSQAWAFHALTEYYFSQNMGKT